MFVECLRNNQWEHKSSICAYFHWFRVNLNLAPRHCFVRTSTRVTSIEFLFNIQALDLMDCHHELQIRQKRYLASIDVYRKICTIAHKICITSMVLDNATSQNNPDEQIKVESVMQKHINTFLTFQLREHERQYH